MGKENHKDFHESSYYDHYCVVTNEEDVLETEIQGRSGLDRVRRWWYEWILLSYDDERSRNFFTSSYAMRMERVRHYRSFKNRIHPLSKFRNFWNVMMLILFMANQVIFHHNTSVTYGHVFHYFYYIGAVMEVIVIIDVFIATQTGYIDQAARKIILEKPDTLLHYGSTKLFLHVASAIPLQCIMFLRYGSGICCSLCKTNCFVATIKFLSIFRLFRIYECSIYLSHERNGYVMTHLCRLMRITLLGLLTLLQFIDMCDTMSLIIMITSGELNKSSFITQLIHTKYVALDPPSDISFLVYNLARIAKSILLSSFSHSWMKFNFDIMSSLVAYLITNLFCMWLIVECFDFISRSSFCEDRVLILDKELTNLISCRHIPDRVTKKVKKYFQYKQSQMRAIEKTNGLFNALPGILKKEAFLFRHRRTLRRVAIFSEWPEDIFDDIVLMLKEEIYLRNELVAEPWVQSEGLLIVGAGELAVYSGSMERGHLIDGDYFGELSLFTDKEVRTSSVVAINSCVMLLLEKTAFRSYMRKYPELFFAINEELLSKQQNPINRDDD